MNHSLRGKKILLAITGSIAAYKAAFLTRLLIKSGADVQVIMTKAATDFITPLTLSTLSKHPVWSEVSDGNNWNNHVELGLWADIMLVAPTTATTLAKLASGLCDNMVVATYLSARCPVFFAPAMDLDMWAHPATQENVRKLISYGNHLIPVEDGELASGLSGKGRMAEPENIVAHIAQFFEQGALKDATVLITAGPTHEALDPVRFLGNRSSGKMGIAIAEVAASAGAKVHLILGPTHLRPTNPKIECHLVSSADEMFDKAKVYFPGADVAILAAAVADYKPENYSAEKIKKGEGDLVLKLVRNPDIAAHLGANKRGNQILVGFALETQDPEANAIGKLKRKNFDFIVLNSLKDKGAGFQVDTNKVKLIDKEGIIEDLPLKSKREVASDIINKILQMQK